MGGQRNRGAVVIVTGPPGAGTTTVAAAQAAGRAQRAVHLHSDDFYGYIRSGYVEPYRPAAHEQHRVVVEVLGGQTADQVRAALAAGRLRLPPATLRPPGPGPAFS